jgi:hypothetical protein
MSKDKKKIYLGYISDSVHNYGQHISDKKWVIIFDKNLKITKEHKPDLADFKEAALILYYSHFLALSQQTGYEKFIKSGKTADELRLLFIKREKTNPVTAVNYTTFKEAIEHISEKSNQGPLKFLKPLLGDVKVEKPIKKTEITKKVEKPIKKTEKVEVEKKTKKKSPMKKSSDQYTVIQLREMAKDKNITGRSKMNKAELCEVLGITSVKAVKTIKPSKTTTKKSPTKITAIKPSKKSEKEIIKKSIKIPVNKTGKIVKWSEALEGVVWPKKFKRPTFLKVGKKNITDILEIRDRMLKNAKCSDYELAQVKELAKIQGIKNYTKMKKLELCEAMGIPEK